MTKKIEKDNSNVSQITSISHIVYIHCTKYSYISGTRISLVCRDVLLESLTTSPQKLRLKLIL